MIALYYYGEVTMKQIGQSIGVNESRVSQLHARAIRRLRDSLGATMAPAQAVAMIKSTVLQFLQKPAMMKAAQPTRGSLPGIVIPYASTSRAVRSKSPSRNGFASQGQPLSSRNRSASVPTTSPVTKISRARKRGRRRRNRAVEGAAVEPRHLQVADHQIEVALAHVNLQHHGDDIGQVLAHASSPGCQYGPIGGRAAARASSS